jgi:hypothetical protein
MSEAAEGSGTPLPALRRIISVGDQVTLDDGATGLIVHRCDHFVITDAARDRESAAQT